MTRIAGLDVLRGVAIMAILFANITSMGGAFWAGGIDPSHYGWDASDRVMWFARTVLLDGTARGLLELLFGAGVAMLTDRWAQTADDGRVVVRFYIRNLLLLAIGLIHVFVLLWPGDILHTYAIAALVVFVFHRLDAAWLLGLGLVNPVLELVGGMIGGATLQSVAQDDRARIAAEDLARSGGFASWADQQWQTFLTLQRWGLEIGWVWEAACTMLIGMALYRWGVLQGGQSRRCHILLMLAGYGLGLIPRVMGAIDQLGDGGNAAAMFAEPARIAMTLGHVGAIHLFLSRGLMADAFAASGRAALSIYLAQTIICLWLLYPPFALGLYGRQDWVGMMATALAVNVMLMATAIWWIRRFRIAPVEWAWRSLAEGQRLPWGIAAGGRTQ